VDDSGAEQFIAGKLSELSQGAKIFEIPAGLGREINADGTYSTANRVLLVPSKSGVKTAYLFVG